jgi:hypothetical protein
MCLSVYAHYMILWPPQGVRRDEVYGNVDKTQALKSGCYLRYIPGGKCKNAGVFKVHGERAQRPPVPRTFHEACSLDPSPLEPGAKRSRAPTTLFSVLQHMATARSTRAAESSGSEDDSESDENAGNLVKRSRTAISNDAMNRSRPARQQMGEERPVNPYCTNRNPRKCYCRSGRARAVVHVDLEGNAIKEYCSATSAAAKLGLSNCSISATCSGGITSTHGNFFRYKVDGDGHKMCARVVLHVDGNTGEVLQEFESARDAMRATGVNNSEISRVSLPI